MHEVIASVCQVTQVMDEISTATREQSHGIGQVNMAVVQIDDLTQQNAALVEQAAAAAGNLAQQAQHVSQAMAVFKLQAVRAQAAGAAGAAPAQRRGPPRAPQQLRQLA